MHQQQMAMVPKESMRCVSVAGVRVKLVGRNSQSNQLGRCLLIEELQLDQIEFDMFKTSVPLCDLLANLS